MAFTKKNEEAVSPVIGVILMVAITVILAAVIAAFVFGMAGNISKTKVVAATAQQPDANTITVTYQGGQDAQSMVNMTTTVTTSSGTTYTDTTPGLVAPMTVGNSSRFSEPNAFGGKDHVVTVGYFSDGSQQVILDNYI